MTRYIDADALIESMTKFSNATGEDMTHGIFYAHIAPTIDAEPVRHGKWIHKGGGIFICGKCSCHIGLNVYTEEKASERFRWCPHCGARMDKDE